MAVTWEELISEHKAPQLVPDEILYNYLVRDDVKQSLIALRQVEGALEKRSLYTEVRRRSKSDLFWLARYFTWDASAHNESGSIDDNGIEEESHRVICEFFTKKDETKSIREQDTWKERLLLFPRGAMKSTIAAIDLLQWILVFPTIRCLYLTATSDLAEDYVREIKGYFTFREENPTLMNIFMPEYCFTEKNQGPAGELVCPVFAATGKKRREPTLLGLGIDQAISGRHFDLGLFDDMINTDNSQSAEQNEKIIRNYYINRKTIMSWGYKNIVGTRYNDLELYGKMLDENVGEIVKENPRPTLEITKNTTASRLIMVGKAIEILPETAKRLEAEGRSVTYKEAGESGCDLLLPKIWSYNQLLTEFADNEFAAESQLNQNPRPTGFTTFDRPLLLQATVHFEEIPVAGIRVNVWDFAYVAKEKRDYTTGAASIWSDSGVCYINDIVRDRFSPTDLAKAVVNLARKTHPVVVGIEDAPGCRFLEDTIINEARKTNDPQVLAVCSRIDWIPLDRSKDAKINRIKSLHPWLVEGRMKFSNHLPFLDVLYREFERCTMSATHDDLPDVVSFMPRFAPRVRQLIASQYQAPLSREDAIAQAQYNLLYGPWLGDSDYGADAYGNLGRGELISVPMEPESPEPEPELQAYSQTPGVDSPLGSGLVG
jgi:phage terminase large subunit-like protein